MAADEVVALYDQAGEVVGSARRSVVRTRNLRHAASSIVVRDPFGRVYVHRRTTTKDVYPGLLDLAAGGVVLAGEDPATGAVREVEEELGVVGAALEPLGVADYADEHTSYRAVRFVVTWDGPIRWQPEEVSWGEWVTVEELVHRLDHDPGSFVPDSVAVWAGTIRSWHADRVALRQGWDSATTLVEQRWVDRAPRRPEVATALLAEVALLSAVADVLPLEVPRPVVLDRDPLRVRHVLVEGEAVAPAGLSGADGKLFARFLTALHATPLTVAGDAGCPSAADDRVDRVALVERFRHVVLPLLPADLRTAGEALLEHVAAVGEQTLCHGDLVTEHVLARDGRLSGVIVWGDARVTDPALDLAWALHATSAPFAAAVAQGVDGTSRDRARHWWALAPWFEVEHDLEHDLGHEIGHEIGHEVQHEGEHEGEWDNDHPRSSLGVVVERLLWWHQG